MLYSASPNTGLVPSASIGRRCLSSFWRRPPRSTPARASFSGQPSVARDLVAQECLIANSLVREASKSVVPSSWTEKIIRHRSRLWRSSSTRGGRSSTRLLYLEQSGGHSSSVGKRSTSSWSTDSAPTPLTATPHEKATLAPPLGSEEQMPPDASSRLTTLTRRLPSRSLGRLPSIFLSLSKPRLSFMIVLTTTTAYSLFPVPALLLPSTTASPSLSTLTLLFLTMGTALSSASANSLNMLLEPRYDAMMSRTRNRPLVRGLVTPGATALFAAVTGVGGLGLLLFGVNPTVAALSGLNIFLYAFVYTPMKRVSVVNTWIGAVVGGIPPLMGWVAAAGQCATGRGDWQELLLGPESAGGWLLAALIFAWQFPHFNALSWNIREEYRQAGHRMLAWVNPKANARVALRYAILCFPICFGLWAVGVTDQGFLLSSSLVNAWLVREAWRFWRNEGAKGSARALFWASVWHLPVVMVLAMLHKNGLWSGIQRSLMGQSEDDVDEDVDENVHDHSIDLVPAASIPVQQTSEV